MKVVLRVKTVNIAIRCCWCIDEDNEMLEIEAPNGNKIGSIRQEYLFIFMFLQFIHFEKKLRHFF